MATNIRSPYKLIKFDSINHQLEKPTLLLKTRGGKYLGKIDYDNLNFSFVAQGLDEISFDVHKSKNGQGTIKNTNVTESLWDKLRDLCIIDYVGYGQFEAHVTVNESNETIKSVQAESVETELGQRLLYEIHINDDKYFEKYTLEENKNKEQVAITFKNDNPALSLLDIVMEKAPHWTITHIDDKFNAGGYVYPPEGMQRTFSPGDGTSIYDFLTGEVAQEFGCAFLFDTYNREIYVKNIDSAVYDITTHKVQENVDFWTEVVQEEIVVHYYNKITGEPIDPEESANYSYVPGIGDDTNIFISPNKLAKDMSADSDKGAIKNCFRVSGGDEVITNMVGAVEATGNNYIYMFDQFQYDDMSPELSTKFKEYQVFLDEQSKLYQFPGGVYIYDADAYYDETDKCCYHRTSFGDKKFLRDALHDPATGKVYVLDTKAYKDGDVFYDKYGEIIPTENVRYNTPGLYNQYQQLLDRANWLEHEMFPNTGVDNPTAAQAFDDLVDVMNETAVYVQNTFKANDYTHILSTAEKTMGSLIDLRYEVKLIRDSDLTMVMDAIDTKHGALTCNITVTRNTDENDTYTHAITVQIYKVDSSDNPNLFEQKLHLAIAKMDIPNLDFQTLDTYNELVQFFKQYNITTLKSFQDGFASCLSTLDDLLQQAGGKGELASKEIYDKEVDAYSLRLKAVKDVLGVVVYNQDTEPHPEYLDVAGCKAYNDWVGDYWCNNGTWKIYTKTPFGENKFDYTWQNTTDEPISDNDGYTYGKLNDLNNLNLAITDKQDEIKEFQDSLDLETYLDDDDLYKELCSYLREQEYNNSNYSSEGLTDIEILAKANELVDTAKKELSKACVSQKTVSGNINDIFALPELQTLYNKFALYNYIRCRIDDRIYKLRLMQIDFSQDSPADLTVTFSDVVEDVTGVGTDIESILNKASSIATSYNYVTNQAEKGKAANSTFADIKQEGLNAAEYILKNSDNEQTTIDQTGILLKSETDVGFYGQHQARITGNGMYLTSDAWDTIDMAVGLGKYNGENRYGVWADVLVGDVIAGEQLLISNNNGSVEINGDGINITNGRITWGHTQGSSVNPPEIEDISNLQVTLNDIADDIEQLDGRIQTFSQPTLPSTSWTTTDEKTKHIKDVWLNTSTTDFTVDGVTYRANVTYVYEKEGNKFLWKETHDSILNNLAKGKSTIFTAQPTTKDNSGYLYRKGDLWIIQENTKTLHGVTYKKDTILMALNDNTTTTIVEADWIEATTKAATDFASDSVITPGEKLQLKYTMMDITQEYTEIQTQANTYRMDISALTTAYNTLKTYTDAFLVNMNENSENVDATTYSDNFSNYYTARKTAEANLETARTEYSDGKLQSWIDGDFATYKSSVETQLDHKIVTYYQASAPYSNETNVPATSTRESRVGDIWYDTDETDDTKNRKKYVRTTNGNNYNYTWTVDTSIPTALFDKIDGKKDIFVLAPTSDDDGDGYLYRKGDMWIISSADQQSSITAVHDLAVQYKVNTILASSVDRKTIFTTSDWSLLTTQSAEQALADISDMCNDGKLTGVEKIQTTRRLAEIDDEKAVYQARKNAYSDNTSVTTAWTTYNTKYTALKNQSANWNLSSETTTDISTNTFTKYFTEYYSAKETLDSALEAASKKYAEDQAGTVDTKLTTFKNKVQGALSGGDPSTEIGNDYIISPMIGGGYLYLVSGNNSVEINPSGGTITDKDSHSTSGYIIRAKQGNTDVFSIDTSGNAYFSGEIEAESGHIGDWEIRNGYLVNETGNGRTTLDPISRNINITTYNTENVNNYYYSTDLTSNGILYTKKPNNTKWYDFNIVLAEVAGISSNEILFQATQYTKTNGLIVQEHVDILEVGVNNNFTPFIIVSGDGYFDGYVDLGESGSISNGDGHAVSGDVVYSALQGYIPTSASCNKNWNWSDGGSQPPWVWGGTNGQDMYVYNPANFSVNYATSAGSASVALSAENANNANYATEAAKSYAVWLENKGDAVTFNHTGISGSPNYVWGAASGSPYVLNPYYGWSSDRRIKNTINPIEDKYSNMFMKLKPVSFKYNNDYEEKIHLGFIAQDVHEAMKESNISDNEFYGLRHEDFGDDNLLREMYPNMDDMYTLDYEQFISLNTLMIQKLYKKIDSLEARIAELER